MNLTTTQSQRPTKVFVWFKGELIESYTLDEPYIREGEVVQKVIVRERKSLIHHEYKAVEYPLEEIEYSFEQVVMRLYRSRHKIKPPPSILEMLA